MDMVTMNIIDSSMVSACREMGITLMKTSYSTIFNEALDFTCALADAQGDMMAVDEIEVFANRMQELGTEYGYPPLVSWGESLADQAVMFDMDGMTQSLGELPEIVVENLPSFVTAAAPEVSKAGNRPFDFPRHNSTSVDLGKVSTHRAT